MNRVFNLSFVFPLLVLSQIVGCGGSSGPPPSAKASGQVTLKGKPLTEGEIYFVAAEKGYSANTTLNAEGKYQITSSLPPASYKIYFAAPRIVKPPMPGKPAPKASSFNLPAKYLSESTSGQVAQVKAGENKFDFALE